MTIPALAALTAGVLTVLALSRGLRPAYAVSGSALVVVAVFAFIKAL